jgi:TrmH family RNA methyltransferase
MLTKAEIARLRSLREKKQRDALGLYVIEGEKVIAELLAAGECFVEIYATADSTTARDAPAAVRTVTAEEMARISHFPTPSGVFAVGQLSRASLDPASLEQGLTLMLDGIQDAGNLGTLLRIADWFGLARVVASPDCVDYFNQKAINATMGSFRRVHFFTHELPPLLEGARVPVLGCALEGDGVHHLPPVKDAIIVLGSEGRGLSPAVRRHVSRFVTIPRHGGAESLNAAIAAAIVCDNLRRLAAG